MIIYTFLFSIFLCLLSNPFKKNNLTLVVFVFISSFLFLLSAFRLGDADYLEYKKIFDLTPELNNFLYISAKKVHGEIGYLFINSTFKYIGFEFTSVIFFIALLSVILTCISSFKLSPAPTIAIILYFSHFFILREMIQIRAGLSISIIIFSIAYCKKKTHIFIFMLIAALFHKASLILLPFIFLYNRKKIRLQIIFIFIFIAYIFQEVNILKLTLNQLSILGFLPTSINNYLSSTLYSSQLPILTNPVFWKAILIILITNKFIETEKKHNINRETINRIIFLWNLYSLGLILMISLSNFSILSGRLSTFLFLGENILITYGLLTLNKKNRLFIGYPFVLLMASLQIYFDLSIKNNHAETSFIFLN